jgi:hypothetical protein
MTKHDAGSKNAPGNTNDQSWIGRAFGLATLTVGSLLAYANQNSISEEIRRGLDPALAGLNQPALIPRLTPLGDPKEIEEISYDEETDSYVALSEGTETRYPRGNTYTQEGNPENPSLEKAVQTAKTDQGTIVYVLIFSGDVPAYKNSSTATDSQPRGQSVSSL